MLRFFSWKWGSKYPDYYFDRLRSGLARNLKQPYQFNIAEPEHEDYPLTQLPGCFCRLRMFDYAWQERWGIKPGDRLVQIDVDTIITGNLDSLFDRDEDFVIMQGGNSSNPCPMNGALWMQRAYTNEQVWTEFNLIEAAKTQFHEFVDDQGWFWDRFPDAAGWKCGSKTGVYVFLKPGWPDGTALPRNARLVTFSGKRDPQKYIHLDWVQKHWNDRPEERSSIRSIGA